MIGGLMGAARRRWRKALNLDGPWICVGCRSWTLVRGDDGSDRCIACGKRQCPCFDGYVDWCEHHGPSPEVCALEARARELSRV